MLLCVCICCCNVETINTALGLSSWCTAVYLGDFSQNCVWTVLISREFKVNSWLDDIALHNLATAVAWLLNTLALKWNRPIACLSLIFRVESLTIIQL